MLTEPAGTYSFRREFKVPQTLPKWVHRELEKWPYFGPPKGLIVALSSPMTAHVWEKLGKLPLHQKRDAARRLYQLADAICEGLDRLTPELRLAAKERKRKATNIASASRRLSRQLDSIAPGDFPTFPPVVEDELASATDQFLDDFWNNQAVHRVTFSLAPTCGVKVNEELISEVRDLLFECADAHVRRLSITLRHLARAADTWAMQRQRYPRPKSSGHRLHFILAISKCLNNVFGRPLHDVTLALTSVWFDCDTLTKAEVAKMVKAGRHKE